MNVTKKRSIILTDKCKDNYQCLDVLCLAIIKQAADDYRYYYKRHDWYACKSLERFFRSDWFEILANDKLSGDYVMKHLKEDCYEKYHCKPKYA